MSEGMTRNGIAAKDTVGTERPPRVHIYSDLFLPEPNNHGAGLVICSQVQAFLDLGFKVEFVFIRKWDKVPPSQGYFKEITCTVVDARDERPPWYARLAYRARWPRKLALHQLYPARNVLLREVRSRIQEDGESIHVFDQVGTANVILDLPKSRMVYSNIEIESELTALRMAAEREITKRKLYGWERRKLRRMSELERKVARSSGLVLCVATEDARRITEEWLAPRAAYLPISIANGDTPVAGRESRIDKVLRLLHIGGISHFPSFTSLEFLFTKVFPLLDADTISRLQFEVVGNTSVDIERTQAIMEMARPYPMVHFSGFVEDIRSAYRRNDLHVVASTHATGLRTRIIESWAFGMPVLSTTKGAVGVEHLSSGGNILIADDPRDFARNLRELIHSPERLDEIAIAARKTYDAYFSRRAVADALRELLNTHFGLRLPPVAAPEGALVDSPQIRP
jgi:glycosyltransferase involved in cell wall biosynthesis